MVIPCLCSFRFSSCTVHHKTAVIPVDIPSRWEPRTNKHPTGVFAAPPAAVPCCSRPVPSTTKKVPRPNGLAASFLVDIPRRWEPRAKQQPTGLIAYSADWRRQSRPVRVLYRHQTKNPQTKV